MMSKIRQVREKKKMKEERKLGNLQWICNRCICS